MSITEAIALLQGAGYMVIPPENEADKIPSPEVGQVWVSPKSKVKWRRIVQMAPHRWWPASGDCVHFEREDGSRSVLHPTAWKAWARDALARPAAPMETPR